MLVVDNDLESAIFWTTSSQRKEGKNIFSSELQFELKFEGAVKKVFRLFCEARAKLTESRGLTDEQVSFSSGGKIPAGSIWE